MSNIKHFTGSHKGGEGKHTAKLAVISLAYTYYSEIKKIPEVAQDAANALEQPTKYSAFEVPISERLNRYITEDLAPHYMDLVFEVMLGLKNPDSVTTLKS